MGRSDTMQFGHSVGDADGVILAADANICDMLHLTERQLIGTSYLDITHPDDRTINTRLLHSLPTGGRPITIRKRYVRRDGQVVPVEVAVSRFSAGERVGRLVGTVRWSLADEHGPARPDPAPDRLWHIAHRADALSRLRKRVFGSELFSDYPMSILIHTYIAEVEGRTTTLDQMALDLDLSRAIAARWLSVLTGHGLLDPVAQDDAPLQLSDAGVGRVERLLAAAGRPVID